jgi:hypothetical protein
MTQQNSQNSQDRENDAPLQQNQERNQPEIPPPTVPKTEDDRENDHRGVLMPRRTRIGGIIMPQ